MMGDALGARRRALEEDYFRKRERELIERLQRRKESEIASRQIGAATGITDLEILRNLLELGYTPETIILLYLTPLLHVAWADGSVSQRERDLIIEVARSRGIQSSSLAYKQLTAWLDDKPPEEFFERTLRLIGIILQVLPPEKRLITKSDLVSYCTQVAEAHGGLLSMFGLASNVSAKERALLNQVASKLEQDHREAADRLIEGTMATGRGNGSLN